MNTVERRSILRRVLLICSTILGIMFLGACAGMYDSNTDKTNQPEDNGENTSNMNGEEASDTNENEEDLPFQDGVIDINDVKLEIQETKVIDPGEKGNEDGENPVFAIWYDATNRTDEEITPEEAWTSQISAIQRGGAENANELEVTSLPNEEDSDTQKQPIKKDETVENSIAYELTSSKIPISFILEDATTGETAGEDNFDIE